MSGRPCDLITLTPDTNVSVRTGDAEVVLPRATSAERVYAVELKLEASSWVIELWNDGYFLVTDACDTGYRLEGIFSPVDGLRIAMYHKNLQRVLSGVSKHLLTPSTGAL